MKFVTKVHQMFISVACDPDTCSKYSRLQLAILDANNIILNSTGLYISHNLSLGPCIHNSSWNDRGL